jgi:hypothetical protein
MKYTTRLGFKCKEHFSNCNVLNSIQYNELAYSAVRAQLSYKEPIELTALINDRSEAITQKELITRDILSDLSIKPIFYTSQEGAQAYLWIKNDTIYISFRGTSNIEDVKSDLNNFSTHIKDGIYVHEGFYRQFLSLESSITEELKKHDDIKILKICGHSLGSAICQISSAYYGEMFPDKNIVCHTIGSPRTGNDKFVEWFSRNVKKNYRVVNKKDIVTMIPLRPLWTHTIDTCIVIDKNCNVLIYKNDQPWWLRILSSAIKIDFISPIKDHDCDEYISRLIKLRDKTA